MLRFKEKHYEAIPQPPFPTARFDSMGPPLVLHYMRWTQMRPECSIPPEAEVDWEHGSARIPEEWSFTVGSNDIDIRARNGVRVHPVSDSYGSMKSMLLPTRILTRLQGQSTDHTCLPL